MTSHTGRPSRAALTLMRPCGNSRAITFCAEKLLAQWQELIARTRSDIVR